MIRFISERLAVKVSLYISLVLLVVLMAGSAFLISKEVVALEDQLYQRGRIQSMAGAKMAGTIIEEAIDNGVFTVKDAFDTAYQEIPGFEPPKYHTKYDSYLDKALLGVLDEFLKDESVIAAVAVDYKGYIPTHNTRYNQPITGDKEKDLFGNRTKRIFADPVGLAAAQNKSPGYRQVYHRDTGEKMWDISSPIMVKGNHWGGFRIGFSLEKINAEKRRLIISTISIMVLVLIVSFGLVFFAIEKALLPVKELTGISQRIAEGQIDQKINVDRKDEIGKLADAVERLRFSIKAAMERLARK